MMKTALIASAVILGAAAPTAQLADSDPAQAEQIIRHLPETQSVIAQFSYLELSHDAAGFSLAITDKTAMFVDLEFPGDFHIRIGF